MSTPGGDRPTVRPPPPAPGPAARGLDADLQALRADAGAWQGLSQDLALPTDQALGLGVEPPAFSFLGEEVGLPGTYAAIQAHVADLLGQAQHVTADISTTLTAAADTYEREEHAGAHRFGAALPPGR